MIDCNLADTVSLRVSKEGYWKNNFFFKAFNTNIKKIFRKEEKNKEELIQKFRIDSLKSSKAIAEEMMNYVPQDNKKKRKLSLLISVPEESKNMLIKSVARTKNNTTFLSYELTNQK